VAQMAAALDPDLFHVHEPELLGATIRRARGRPVVWDVHESYLDVIMDRHWIPPRLRPAVRAAWDWHERRLLRRCAGVVVATTWLAPRYVPLHPRLRVVANFPELGAFEGLPPTPRDGRTCVFVGVLGVERGLLQVLQALAILNERGLSIPLELAGRSPTPEYLDGLLREAERLGVRRQVTYHGVLPRAEAVQLAHRASIGLVPHLPYRNGLATWPVKMMEFMALGLPLVFSDLPNHREIACGAGIAVDPRRPEAIADAVETLVRRPDVAREMGRAGRQAARERFNWDAERVKLLDLYAEILQQGHRS